MATFNKHQAFIEKVFEGAIDLASDTIKAYLTNTAPTAANDEFADITEIAAGNGYSSGGITISISASSQTGGTYKAVASDGVVTASGGSVGPFRYAGVYDDTASGKPLIGWWDYGSAITLLNGEIFTIDFDATNGLLQAV